jgi:hypothetical protein
MHDDIKSSATIRKTKKYCQSTHVDAWLHQRLPTKMSPMFNHILEARNFQKNSHVDA